MNILIINHYAGGPELGSEMRPFLLAKAWTRMGDKVTIVAADYSHKRRQNPKIGKDLEEIKAGEITCAFLTTPPYESGVGSQNRNITIFARKLWGAAPEIAKKYAPDVVVASSGHPFDSFAARRIAKKSGAALVFELHENWPDIQGELYGPEPEVRLARWAMGRALQKSQRVVSLLPRGKEYLREFKVPEEKCTYIPEIYVDAAGEAVLSQRRKDYLRRLQGSYDFLVLYQGHVSQEKGLGRLVEAAKLLEDQNVAVAIVGNGGYKINLKRQMRELAAANVYLLDRAEEEEKPGIFALADCLFYGDDRSSAVQYGVRSSKLLEYMNAGKPVITALKTAESPVVLARCGFNVAGEEPLALAKSIIELKALSKMERGLMGERGREYLRQHHDAARLAKEFHRVLTEAVEEKNSPAPKKK